MNLGLKSLRYALLPLCLLFIPLCDVAAEDSMFIRGQVLLQDGSNFKEPGVSVRVTFKGPNNQKFTRWTATTGAFDVGVNDLGIWYVTARKDGYLQTVPRPVLVKVNDKRTVTTDPPELRLEYQSTPTPTPTPTRGGGGGQAILILYQSQLQATTSPASTTAPECPGDERRGRVMSGTQPLAKIEISVTVNNSKTDKLEDYLTIQTKEDGTFDFMLPKEPEYDEYIFTIEDVRFEPYTLFLARNECLPADIILVLRNEDSDGADSLRELDEATRRLVFSPEVMQALPVGGVRNFDFLALLAPGVLPPPEPLNPIGPGISPGLGLPGQFSVNGLRSRENNFTIDGSDNNDEDIGTRRQGFVIVTPQSIESLQEFQVVTALADARFGRNLGGQINAVTKSGANKYHGALYGFFTNHRLNARNFFDQETEGGVSTLAFRRTSTTQTVVIDDRLLTTTYRAGEKDSLTHTQAGFTAGGPIKSDTVFFFASLERQLIRATKETHFAVPTVRERGVFGTGGTGLLADASMPSASRLSLFPASLPGNAIFSLYPFPNNPLGPYRNNTYSVELPADGNGIQASGKIESKFGNSPSKPKRRPWSFFSDGDIFRVRYNFTQDKRIIPAVGNALYSSLRARVRTQNASLSLNRFLTARLSDTIRFSFGRTRLNFDEVRDASLLPSSLFPNTPFLLNAPLLLNVTTPGVNQTTYTSAASEEGANRLRLLGYSSVTQAEQLTGPLGQVIIPGFSQLGLDVDNFPQSRANTTIQVGETVTYTRGDHISIFGADVRKVHINSELDRGFRPQAVFNGLRSTAAASALRLRAPDGTLLPAQPFSGTTLAAMGLPTGLFQTLAVVPNSNVGIRFTQVNLFAQSQLRVRAFRSGDNHAYRPNMQFTLGLRYEINTVPQTVGSRLERTLDPAELRAEATRVAARCNSNPVGEDRCRDLVGALTSAFPTDFRLLFGGDRDDFNIRLGYVVDLLGDGRLVTRVGLGTYPGQVLGTVIGQTRNAFPDFLPLNLAALPPVLGGRTFLFNLANPQVQQLNPALNLLAPGTLNTLAVSPIEFLINRVTNQEGLIFEPTVKGLDLILPQSKFKPPYSIQYGVTTEWQFSKRYLLGVSYVGTRGIKLLRVATPDLGLNRRFGGTDLIRVRQLSSSDPFPFFFGTIQPPQTDVISKSFVIARTLLESSASSTYNSLQVEVRKRYSKRFYFGTALTYSHAIDNASDIFDTAGAFALPQNSLRHSERASSNYDVRWRSVTFFVKEYYRDSPFHKGKGLGGWQVSGVITAQTGQPYTVNTAFDINRDGNLTDRLNTTSGLLQSPVQGDRRIQLSLAPGVNPFDLLAPDGSDGAIGRNTFRAPGIINFDVSLTKYLIRNERYNVYFRTEVFNLFNRTHFGIPERILESPAFGTSVKTIIPARNIRFAMKVSF